MVSLRRDEGNWRAYLAAGGLGLVAGVLIRSLAKNGRKPQNHIENESRRSSNEEQEPNDRQPRPISAGGSKNEWHPEERRHRERERRYWVWSIIVGGIAMGGAVTAAIFTGSSVQASWKAVRLNRQTIVEDNRAWVGANDADIEGPIVSGKPFKIDMFYQNFGKGPAINIFPVFVPEVISNDVWDTNDPKGGFAQEDGFINLCKTQKPSADYMVLFPSPNPSHVSGTMNDGTTAPLGGRVSFSDIVSGKQVLLLEACFAYETYGTIRHTISCFYCRAHESDMAHLSICARAYAD